MKYFTIHDIVGIEVSDQYKWKDTLIINIPMFYTTKEKFHKIKTKITIEYNKGIHLEGAYEVVSDIFINRNTHQILDKKYGALISKEKDGYKIICNQECNEWMMMILEYALLENQATFIHSAGVIKDGNAYVFPSWGGVGKTASVAKLIREEGYQLLGDDLVILTSDGTIYAFPKKFVLYAYHRELFEDAMQNKKLVKGGLSRFVSKLIPTAKSFLRHFPFLLSWARRHNPQSKRVSPYEIFGEDKIATSGHIKKFTWLERIDIEKTKTVEIDAYKLASKSLMITIHELFDNRLQEFFIATCADCFEYRVLFDESIKFIHNAVKKSKINQLFIPQSYHVNIVASDVVAYTKQGD